MLRNCTSFNIKTIVTRNIQAKVDLWKNIAKENKENGKKESLSITASLLSNKQFKNPKIISRLIDFMEIDEYDTMLPNSWFNYETLAGPNNIGYIDQLELLQKNKALLKEEANKKRKVIDFKPSSKK